jgi:hypothetical protein
MNITFRIEILILIAIVLFILSSHLLCSCSTVSPYEAMTTIKEGLEQKPALTGPTANILNGGGGFMQSLLGSNKRGGSMSGPQSVALTEGFTGANINYGQSAPFQLNDNTTVNTSSWFTPNLTYKPGQKPSKGAQNILNREKQPVPLPKSEMLMFATTEFKPECCPNTYSNSTGCACMTVDQYNYLIDRGGNNVPYSEY